METFKSFLSEKKTEVFIGITGDPDVLDIVVNKKLWGHIRNVSGKWIAQSNEFPTKLDVSKHINWPNTLKTKIIEFFKIR